MLTPYRTPPAESPRHDDESETLAAGTIVVVLLLLLFMVLQFSPRERSHDTGLGGWMARRGGSRAFTGGRR